MNPKPEATVLDCTAANRMFWVKKESDKVLWTDIEPDLEIKPDMVVDIRKTEFIDGQFKTIIFDPPHWWGDQPQKNYYSNKNEEDTRIFIEKYNMKWRGVCYYGTDKYVSKKSLLGFINASQKEIYRILDDDGVLWFNWSDVKIPLVKILPFFDQRWDVMIKLQIGSRKQSLSKHQNWWVMLMKKSINTKQLRIKPVR